ncbi:hypothetical protein JI435_433700 [Parastagonospora nodorum SN15]|uniref:Uncharacterized protein n=1 Tax=Phaeosphaeria nodorum (strain SN15 / ATCC MYA-4574 / FGSC 10173) TaxID=321614 RepID=A0A7U2HYC9_PHANO|nr:hypothetical protein JI435_433700 [Parastagonospora nodorum SN15]
MVTDPTGREFGRVDMKSSTGLCPLIDGAKANGLIWMAWTDIRRKQAGEGPPGSPFSGLISMTLQLYWQEHSAATTVFELQRYDYYNPQDGDSLTRIQAIDPSFQTDQFTQQGPTPGEPGSIYVLRSVDEIRADVADVFDTVVSKSDEVPTREPSSHIKTELYPHQKQALYFMWDKEQDHSAEEHDQRKDTLWAPRLRDNGRKFYRLVITGEDTHFLRFTRPATVEHRRAPSRTISVGAPDLGGALLNSWEQARIAAGLRADSRPWILYSVVYPAKLFSYSACSGLNYSLPAD